MASLGTTSATASAEGVNVVCRAGWRVEGRKTELAGFVAERDGMDGRRVGKEEKDLLVWLEIAFLGTKVICVLCWLTLSCLSGWPLSR